MALLRSETRIYGNATVDTFLKIDGNNTNFPATSSTTGALRVAGGVGVIGNIFSSGNITANNISGTLTTANQYNITSIGTLGNLSVTNYANVGTLSATDGIFSGNVTVNGNFVYANVSTLNIKDPIIEQGGNTDGFSLSADDYKDRGTLLHYYNATPIDAFMGWDNSNSEFAFGSNVSVSGDIVTFNTFGNIRASNFLGTATSAITAGTVTTNAQPNITSVGTLGNLNVSGNISGTLTTSNQYNITNVGILTGVTINGPAVLGNVANVTLYGGDTGQFLKTDGNGNVSWSRVGQGNANISGNVYEVFFNNGSNTLGSSANLSYNPSSDTLSVSNISANTVYGTFFGNVVGNLVGNISVVGNASEVVIVGNGNSIISSGNLNFYTSNNTLVSNYFKGNGSALTSLTGSSVTGNVAYAVTSNWANTANAVAWSAISNTPNTISGYGITDAYSNTNASAYLATATFTTTGNISANVVTANTLSGNGSAITYVAGSNISGNVSYAVTSNWANTANAVAWSAISNTPNTLSGYGITDAYSNSTAGSFLSNYTGNLSANVVKSESLEVHSTANFAGTSNVFLGDVANIKITGGSNNYVLQTDGAGNLSWVSGSAGVVGNAISLGSPTVAVDTAPGNLTTPGVVSTWTTDTKITDAIDDLNEVMENVRNSTYVKVPTFTANVTSAGQGTYIGLNIPTTPTTTYGNPNRWDINWGDSSYSNGITSLSPIPYHQYNTNANSPFSVTVRAYNNNGVGTGSEASYTRTGYIIIYTANPVMGFSLYRGSTGGTALTGSNVYVSEGETFYLENTTTNTSGATVTYTVNWGDGNTEPITSDSVAGGVGGGRLSHTYATGQQSGTGTKTITLTLTAHSTCTPSFITAGISNFSTSAIKIYNPSITAPNGLSSKTISFQTSVGTSPYLAANYANNAGGSVSTAAGSSIGRVTSGTPVETIVMSTYAYNADSGYLRAIVNNTEDGNIALTTGSQAGTNASLVLSAESDYNLLDATGTSTTFGLSIYSPSLYKGFTAKVSKTNSALTAGLNTFKLSHSSTGNTNIVEFVKDDVTSVPTVDVSTATLSNATNGTYRYISGVPYYNTGSPTITLASANIYNWIGQTYQNTSTPFQIEAGTNDESTTGNVVALQTKTYSNLDGATTFLSGGIPKANTGNTSSYAYTIGSQTINITASSVASVQTVKFLATNVNGSSAYAAHSKKVQVFTATPSGFVEDSITCSIGGDNTVAKRIVLAGTGATRSYTGGGQTNFYTSAAWSGVQTVAGTDSAIVRWNQLKWFNTDLSGYLPAGPNLNTGRSGTQYFFGAFTRASRSGFTVTITGKISGLKFAVPGVTDNLAYTTNGWLDATVVYFGSGVAGAQTSGCAATVTVPTGTVISGTSYAITFGEGSTSSAGNWSNQVLFSIALASGDYVSSWSFS